MSGLFLSCEKENDLIIKDKMLSNVPMEGVVINTITTDVLINYLGDEFMAKFDGEHYYIMGDIKISKYDLEEHNKHSKLKAAGVHSRKWPNNIVYYTINSSVPDQQRIHDAIDLIESSTNVMFKLKNQYTLNYIEIVYDSASTYSSSIGMNRGRQEIGIADWATYGNVAHEFLHALGAFHEQSRVDRDDHIIVNFQHIESDETTQYQYKKYTEQGYNGYDYGAFDFNSIMLYSSSFYNGGWSMTDLDGNPFFAQRNNLSTTDRQHLNSYYPFIDVTIKGSTSLLNINKTGESFSWTVDFGNNASTACEWTVQNGGIELGAGSGTYKTLYAHYDSSLRNGQNEICVLRVNCPAINSSASIQITVKDGYKLYSWDSGDLPPIDL